MSFRRVFNTTATTFRHFASNTTKLPADLEASRLLNYTRVIQSFSPLIRELEFSKLKGNIQNPKYPDDKRERDQQCLRIVTAALNGSVSRVLLFIRDEEAHLTKACVDQLNELGFKHNVLVAHSPFTIHLPTDLNVPKANIFSFTPNKEIDLVNELKAKAPGVLGVLLGLNNGELRLQTVEALTKIKGVKYLGTSDKTLKKIADNKTLPSFMKTAELPGISKGMGYQNFDRVDVVVCEGDVLGMFKCNENGALETYQHANSPHFNNLRLGLACIYEHYQGPLTLSVLIPHKPANLQARLLNVSFGITHHYLACKDNTALDLIAWTLRQSLSRVYLPARNENAQSLRELVEKPHCHTLQIPIIPCSSLRVNLPKHGETTYTLLNGTITDIDMPASDLGEIDLLVSKGSELIASLHSAPLPIGHIRVSADTEQKACEKMAELLAGLQFYVNNNPVDFNLTHEKFALAERLTVKTKVDTHPTPKMR